MTESHPHHIARGKIVLIIVILVVLVGAVAAVGYLPKRQREAAANEAAREEKNDLPLVTVARVRRSPADTELVLPGSITPLAEASIYARAAGYVRRRLVDIGDRVRAGQLMAEIEAPELDQQVAQARAAVAQAQQQLGQTNAALVQAQSQRDLAKLTSDRYANLVQRGAVARQDADQQATNFASSDALVKAQQSNVGAGEQNVQEAQANLRRVLALQDYKNVRAPLAGVVTARNIDVGSLISAAGAGQGNSPMNLTSTPTAGGSEMYRVAQITTVRILESVPQANAPSIVSGMPAEVTVNEFPGRKFIGKVARTSSSFDPSSRTMLVEVQVVNSDGKLLPGMYAEVHFRSHRDKPPLLIPGDALITGSAGPQVATLTSAGEGKSRKIHLQPVQVGRDYGPETEIAAGLDGSETVVLNPGDEVREGALVRAEGSQKAAPKQ